MSYKGYEFFYTNGSSHTKGGGLEEELIRPGHPAQKEYKKQHGIEWNNRDEVNWATRLSEKIRIPVFNEAECGAGTQRAIRMTYEFIEKNWDEIGKYFIILELNDPFRIDVFYSKSKQYYIVNMKDNDLQWATPNYFPIRKDDDAEQEIFRSYIKNHVNWDNLGNIYHRDLVGLYSFCKQQKIPIKILNLINHSKFKHCYDLNDLVTYDKNNLRDIFNFCINTKSLIWDEVENVNDGHPGYFGHIKYAEFLKDWLDLHLEERN